MKKNRMTVCLMVLVMILGSTGLINAFADDSAALTVTKSVIGSQQNASEIFQIVVTINTTTTAISLANGGSMVFENLPYGSSYSIVENANDGYTTAYLNESGTLIGTPVTATVINTVKAVPATEVPAAAEPVIEQPVAEEPVIEQPAAEEPAIAEPVAEQPVAEEPVIEQPVAEQPVVEEPASEQPVAEQPVVEEPASEEPVAEQSVVEEPAVVEPVAEQPVVEEHAVEEPMAEQPVVEEPAVVEPAVDEPAVVEPSAEITAEPEITDAPAEIDPETIEALSAEEAPAAPVAIVVPVGTLTIGGSALYLYAAPSADAEKLMTLDPASQVTVLSQDESWAFVAFEGMQGYVPKVNLVMEEPVSLDNLAVYTWFVNEPEKVQYGDVLTLQGKLVGFENLPYEYYTVWQRASMSKNRVVGNDWVDIGGANALTHSFTVNDTNEWYGWRLAVRVTVPDDVGIGN